MEEAFIDPIPKKRISEAKKPVGLGWEGSWYENEDRKRSHRDLVLAGMERARLQGKRIGRPKVIEREGFLQRFLETVSRIGQDGISRNQAARELGIGYATFKRLLDPYFGSPDEDSIEEERLVATCQ